MLALCIASLLKFIILMMQILMRQARAGLSQTQQIPLSLPFPYEYTLAPYDFSLQDIRFKELPFSREFAPPERDHLLITLQNFQQLLNTGKSPGEYVQQSLTARALEVRGILAESKVTLEFQLHGESVVKSQGYLEVKPAEGLSLQERDLQCIHRYLLDRERETLTVSLRPQRQTLTAEEQLKKDITEKMGQSSREVREKLQNMRFSKQALFVDRFLSRLMAIGKPTPKRRFEPYFIVDQIQGEMDCRMAHQGMEFRSERVSFDSKWLYWVNNLESEDLKRHRKRTLFDFQYWNRGTFFPIRNYAAEIAHLD